MNKGEKHSKETRKKISEALKGNKGWLGKKRPPFSKEHRQKISKALKGKSFCGKRFNRKGLKHSEETKSKMSKARKRNPIRYWLGKKRPPLLEEHREKLRKSKFEYAKKTAGIVYPVIGRNEIQILDELEIKLGHRIIRQFQYGGYYLDGYIPEINLAIEIDEKPKNTERDINREEFIKQKFGCKFLRIKDYNYNYGTYLWH